MSFIVIGISLCVGLLTLIRMCIAIYELASFWEVGIFSALAVANELLYLFVLCVESLNYLLIGIWLFLRTKTND